LTEYLAEKTLDSPKLIITSAAGHTRSNRDVGPFPDNNHEEADTLMICLGVSATERNPVDAQMTFFSPDTDVLVLIIANYDRLPKNTSISMADRGIMGSSGARQGKGFARTPCIVWADNTGRFARIGKPTWFKLFMEAEEDVIEALCTLCDDADVSEDLQLPLAKFVCTAYRQKDIQLSSIPELRWHLFCKYIAESEKLPPTLGALKQHILRARVQARVWGQAAVPQQELLDSLENGYHRDSDAGQLKPTTIDVPPAPEAIVEMVRCQCKGNCSSNRCSCKSENFPCTDLCLCNTQCENDADTHYDNRELMMTVMVDVLCFMLNVII